MSVSISQKTELHLAKCIATHDGNITLHYIDCLQCYINSHMTSITIAPPDVHCVISLSYYTQVWEFLSWGRTMLLLLQRIPSLNYPKNV